VEGFPRRQRPVSPGQYRHRPTSSPRRQSTHGAFTPHRVPGPRHRRCGTSMGTAGPCPPTRSACSSYRRPPGAALDRLAQPAGRWCSVHAEPSQYRRSPAEVPSGYHPGGTCPSREGIGVEPFGRASTSTKPTTAAITRTMNRRTSKCHGSSALTVSTPSRRTTTLRRRRPLGAARRIKIPDVAGTAARGPSGRHSGHPVRPLLCLPCARYSAQPMTPSPTARRTIPRSAVDPRHTHHRTTGGAYRPASSVDAMNAG
jgi:hypothetical protein